LLAGAALPEQEEDEIDTSGGSSVYGEITYDGVVTVRGIAIFGPGRSWTS
jgi:hypothetical protein